MISEFGYPYPDSNCTTRHRGDVSKTSCWPLFTSNWNWSTSPGLSMRPLITAGAVTSILLGTVVPIFWQRLFPEIPAIYPALFASLLGLFAVSFATPPPHPSKLVRLEHPNP